MQKKNRKPEGERPTGKTGIDWRIILIRILEE
jgi:hypothetical protein